MKTTDYKNHLNYSHHRKEKKMSNQSLKSVSEERKEELISGFNIKKENSKEIKIILQAIDEDATVKIDPDKIKVNENIRREIDTSSVEFKQLVDSIKTHGLLQSLVVEFRQKDHENYEFICVAGHRRLAALKLLKYTDKVPVKFMHFHRKGASSNIALTENVIRKELHFIELADVYFHLNKNEDLTPAAIAEKFDKSKRTVEYYLKMGKWPEEIKSKIYSNKDLFPLRYVWDNYVLKKKDNNQIIRSIAARIKNRDAKPEESVEQKLTIKDKRMQSLQSYYKSNKISKTIQDEITKALKHIKIIN